MQIALYVFLGLALTWIVFLIYLWTSSKALQGKSVAHLQTLLPQLANYRDQVLLYCFSPSCGPCRRMSPTIDALCEQGEPIIKVDISEAPDVSRELEIRAAPTLMLIRHGVIDQVEIGARSREQIEAMLYN